MRRLVEDGGGRVRFVRLRVGEQEQERRIVLPERSEFHKINSLETLRRLRTHDPAVEQPPADLDIDTERLDPPETAAAITDYFRLTAQPLAGRYPGAGV